MNQYLYNFETKYQCTGTVASRDDWLIRIGHRFINWNHLPNEYARNGELVKTSQLSTRGVLPPIPQGLERSLYAFIEDDPICSYYYIEREYANFQILIPKMAIYLSPRTIEIICDKMFSKRNIYQKFVELIYEYFFPIYFKRVYSWSSLHMLIKASKAYPENFKTTIRILFRDTNIPNNILLDYVETLNVKNCTNLLKYVSQFQFTPEEFNHNLPVLYLMYKKCEKDETVFQFIQSNLRLYNQQGAYSKKYGRLLLCFVENLSGFNVRVKVIKKMIRNHFTPYKSPCMAALEKFVTDILAVQEDFYEEPRIIIPRPTEDFGL